MTPEEMEKRIERLETIVCDVLARGLLLNEYGKDLRHHGVEEACKKLSWYSDLDGAVAAVASK
jgi:hypothetical protein